MKVEKIFTLPLIGGTPITSNPFSWYLTNVECPDCRQINVAVVHSDDPANNVEFTCGHCGYEEPRIQRQVSRQKGGPAYA